MFAKIVLAELKFASVISFIELKKSSTDFKISKNYLISVCNSDLIGSYDRGIPPSTKPEVRC